ncbi:hypothetical protein BTVI_39874 [Pitangus sulphuratus]|nr:hypothetical protein BTVI_39874 [Pitangus sulphuratus]
MPGGSKTDPPLDKDEPISDFGTTSRITDLRRERIFVQKQLQPKKRGVRKQQPCRHQVNHSITEPLRLENTSIINLITPCLLKHIMKCHKERRGTLDAGTEIPLQPVVHEAAEPLQPMEVHGRVEIHLQHGNDPTSEQVDD